MDTRRLDTVAKLFVDRRLSRRKALAQDRVGLAAASLAASFGVSRTPAAVVIDEREVVVSPAARGAEAVRALSARSLPTVVAAG